MLNQLFRYVPIINFIKINKPATLCEIGSGSYGIGKFMDVKFIGVDVNFNDYSSYTKHGANLNPKMTQIIANAEHLPFPDNSIDIVFSLDMFEHLTPQQREKALSEAIRVSKNYVIIGFPCGEAARNIDQKIANYYLLFKKKVPVWLQEHLIIPFPETLFMEGLLREKPYNSYKYRIVYNENICFHYIISILESLPLVGDFLGYLSVSKILPRYQFNFGICYRKIYFIEK